MNPALTINQIGCVNRGRIFHVGEKMNPRRERSLLVREFNSRHFDFGQLFKIVPLKLAN